MNILKKCRRALATLLAVGTAFVATAAWAATPLTAPTWTMHSVKNTEIKLEWSKVDNALNYTVYFKESTADKFRQYAVVATNSTTYYGVKNKSYDFYLVANPKAGKGLEKSAASETKTILLNEEANPKEPLPTPTWTMASVKNTEIKLEWSKVEDALNYTLYYKESTASKFQQLVVATNSTTYYGIKNRTYDFFVVANPKYNDGNAVSAASETKTILLNEEANPKQPLPTPTWTMTSVKNTEIKLEWSEVADALNYTVYYKESTASKFQQLAVVATNSTTYYGIKNRSYDFYVVANPKYNDGNAASAASETKTILLNEAANPKQTLATPTWTNVSASKTKISLSWNEVDGALNYSLFYKEATAKNYVKLVIGKTSTTYYGIKGKTYEFYLVANPEYNNGYEVSAASETKTITLDGNNVVNPPVDPNPNPDTPDNPSNPPVNPDTPSMPENQKTPIAAPVLSAKVSGTTITVSWNDVDNARGYEVFWREKGELTPSSSGEIDKTSCQITGVAGKTYEIFAFAFPKKNLAATTHTKSEQSKTIEATVPEQGNNNPNDGLTPLPGVREDSGMNFSLNASVKDGLVFIACGSSDWHIPAYYYVQVIESTGNSDKDIEAFNKLTTAYCFKSYPGERPEGLEGLTAMKLTHVNDSGDAMEGGKTYAARVCVAATEEEIANGYTHSAWSSVLWETAAKRDTPGAPGYTSWDGVINFVY